MKKILSAAVAAIGVCGMCDGMFDEAASVSSFDHGTRRLDRPRRSDFVDVRPQVSQPTDISLSDSGHSSTEMDSLSSSSDESASTDEPVLLSTSLSSPELYPLHTPHSSPTTSRSKSLSPPSAERAWGGGIIRPEARRPLLEKDLEKECEVSLKTVLLFEPNSKWPPECQEIYRKMSLAHSILQNIDNGLLKPDCVVNEFIRASGNFKEANETCKKLYGEFGIEVKDIYKWAGLFDELYEKYIKKFCVLPVVKK